MSKKKQLILSIFLYFLILFSGSLVFGQELFEYSHDNRSFEAVWGINWKAQTFTPSVFHQLTSVKLLFQRGTGLTIGTITVGIRATAEDKPVGNDLCFGTLDGSTISESVPSWYEIDLSCELEKDVKYSIVVRCPDADDYALKWRDSYPENVYPSGSEAWSSNSGSSWQLKAYDFDFEEWGEKPFFFAFTTKDLSSTTGYIGDVFTGGSSIIFYGNRNPFGFLCD